VVVKVNSKGTHYACVSEQLDDGSCQIKWHNDGSRSHGHVHMAQTLKALAKVWGVQVCDLEVRLVNDREKKLINGGTHRWVDLIVRGEQTAVELKHNNDFNDKTIAQINEYAALLEAQFGGKWRKVIVVFFCEQRSLKRRLEMESVCDDYEIEVIWMESRSPEEVFMAAEALFGSAPGNLGNPQQPDKELVLVQQFTPKTKQVWDEASGSDSRDFTTALNRSLNSVFPGPQGRPARNSRRLSLFDAYRAKSDLIQNA